MATERSIYQCPLCSWWEGDANGEGVGHCNGRPEAPHALVEMERVEVVPAVSGTGGSPNPEQPWTIKRIVDVIVTEHAATMVGKYHQQGTRSVAATIADALRDELRESRAREEKLREALERIAECSCTCSGYYKCNGCEQRGPEIAEAALADGPSPSVPAEEQG